MRLPASALLGKENKGFYYLMAELPQVRGMCLLSIGRMQRQFLSLQESALVLKMMYCQKPPWAWNRDVCRQHCVDAAAFSLKYTVHGAKSAIFWALVKMLISHQLKATSLNNSAVDEPEGSVCKRA